MTYIELERVRELFPELQDIDAIRVLMAEVSGMDPAAIPLPSHDITELSNVAPVQSIDSTAGYLGFDSFARRVCDADRVALQKAFEGVEVSTKHAPDLAESAWLTLVDRVQQVSVRTLIATMYVLREQGQLQGRSSEERYRYFCRLSAGDDFKRRLLQVFPELSNQIYQLRTEAIATLRDFLTRLDQIKRNDQFQAIVGSDPVLLSLTPAGSDAHAGGQSVLIAEFEDHATRIVYKPRRMRAEVGFTRLVERFNQRAATNLPTLRIIDSDDHGWQEYANTNEGDSTDEYFRKCGHLLAILHITSASDMHYENVINHDGGPVVVDAETLFSVNMRRDEGGKDADEAMVALAESVFSTGFLPSRIDTADEFSDSVDIGFLGYEPDQTAITASITFRNIGTDEMSVDFGLGKINEASVVPPTATSPNAPGKVAGAFGELYDWIRVHKQEVSSWIEELFSGVHVRAVLDNTRKYYQLLSLATHPEFQMSPELTTALFHRCGIGRLEHVTPAVILAEVRDLKRRDIPYFTLRTDETGVYDSENSVIADPLANTPLAKARQHIEAMSERKRDFNMRTIESSFVNKTNADLDRPNWERRSERHNHSVRTPAALSSNDLDNLVRSIARQYARFAIRPKNGSPVEWLGSTLSNTAQVHPWRFRQLSDGLYAGRSGLSLFLTAASQYLGESEYADLAEDYLLPRANELIRDSTARKESLDGGMGDGYPGIAYALINGGRISDRKEWETTGFTLLRLLRKDVDQLNETDQLMGTAGILSFASHLLEDPSTSQQDCNLLHAINEKAFYHLRSSAAEACEGERIYSGYAHGLAGSIAALCMYGVRSPSAKALADKLEQRFSSLFTDVELPWAISTDAPSRRAHGWCHGAPGILVSELVRFKRGATSRGPHIEALTELVADECFDLNFSLCHGDIGNLVILQQAAELQGRRDLLVRVRQMTNALAKEIVPQTMARHNAKTLLNDAFMVGLPGVVYGLMQLRVGGRLPDVFVYGIVQ